MEKEPLIDPIPVEVLKSELTPARKLRDTNKGHNEIYVVDWRNAPNTLREIGLPYGGRRCGRGLRYR